MRNFTLLVAAVILAFSSASAAQFSSRIVKANETATHFAKAQKRVMGIGANHAKTKAVTVIEDQPEGEEVVYARTGGQAFLYDYDEESVSLVQPTGVVSVVYGDGNKVYMKNPIFDNEFDTWIEGTVNADGTKLTFPTGQYIVYSDDYGYGIQVYAGKLNSAGTSFTRNMRVLEFTYTIDKEAGTMALDDFVNINSILGVFYSDDSTWAAGGEYLSTFETTVVPSTDPVVPPTGLVTDTWYVNGDEEDEDGSLIPMDEFTVQLGFDGSDVYLKGISVDLPDAWIKGTVDASGNITFDNNIYIGEMYGYDIYFVGYNYDAEKVASPVFTYDAENEAYSSEDGIVINADPFKLYYWQWMDNVVISRTSGGVNAVVADKQVASESYTGLDGVKVANPERGVYVKTIRYADGSVKNVKVVK